VSGKFRTTVQKLQPQTPNEGDTDCPQAIGCIISDHYIVISQDGEITGHWADIVIGRDSGEIKAIVPSKVSQSGYSQALLQEDVRQFMTFAVFLGFLPIGNQTHLVFGKRASQVYIRDNKKLYKILSIETVEITSGKSDETLQQHLNEVEQV